MKLLLISTILLSTDGGMRYNLNQKIGKLSITALRRTNLPAIEIWSTSHPSSLHLILWIGGFQKAVFLEDVPMDAPKYLKGPLVTLQPSISAHTCNVWELSEKPWRLLFWKLIESPDINWKHCNTLLTPLIEEISLLIKRITSSANWIWEMYCWQLGSLTPLKTPVD